MNRHVIIRRLLASLSVGLLGTVAVAWLIAIRPDQPFRLPSSPSPSILQFGPPYFEWQGRTRLGFVSATIQIDLGEVWLSYVTGQLTGTRFVPPVHLTDREFGATLPSWSRIFHTEISPVPFSASERGVGWPFIALRGYKYTYLDSPDSQRYQSWGLLPISSTHRRASLPYAPVCSGFLANTLIYSLVAFLALNASTFFRSFYRRHRNLCPSCAYPLRQSQRCPECGTATPRSEVA